MKLYDSKNAPNPRRTRIFISEKGLDIPTEEVDIGSLQTRTPEFLAKNPMGRVPVLELDDGSHIAESIAICRYLEALHPDPPLFGTTPEEVANVEMWVQRVEYNLAERVFGCFQNTHDYMKERMEQVPAFGEVARKGAIDFLAVLDERLGRTKFIAGDRYTMADISAQMAIDFGKVVKIRIADDQKNLQRWHVEVSVRPSASA
ncbi:MAG: glutathione S-transferase family protein [Myxococcota bacterium]|nr:glutathione S-transferase family protein [Myxococcota bacterium]